MRHLLDLNDLLEEELCHIYQAENKLLDFIKQIRSKTRTGPLLDWIMIYQELVNRHSAMIRKIFYQLFLPIEEDKTFVVEDIIEEYRSAVTRTRDDSIREEELILALTHIIHYKIAAYSTLCVHARALKYWDETIGLHVAEEEEKEMAANLKFLSEKHSVFLNDWYAF
ncbi:MAG: DUF892 family protein [Cyclobacteriaceae bacterium]